MELLIGQRPQLPISNTHKYSSSTGGTNPIFGRLQLAVSPSQIAVVNMDYLVMCISDALGL